MFSHLKKSTQNLKFQSVKIPLLCGFLSIFSQNSTVLSALLLVLKQSNAISRDKNPN